MSRLTENAELVHLLSPGPLKASSFVPTIKNNKKKVVFSILLSDSFPEVPNYFLYLGSTPFHGKPVYISPPKLCDLQGTLVGYVKGVESRLWERRGRALQLTTLFGILTIHWEEVWWDPQHERLIFELMQDDSSLKGQERSSQRVNHFSTAHCCDWQDSRKPRILWPHWFTYTTHVYLQVSGETEGSYGKNIGFGCRQMIQILFPLPNFLILGTLTSRLGPWFACKIKLIIPACPNL